MTKKMAKPVFFSSPRQVWYTTDAELINLGHNKKLATQKMRKIYKFLDKLQKDPLYKKVDFTPEIWDSSEDACEDFNSEYCIDGKWYSQEFYFNSTDEHKLAHALIKFLEFCKNEAKVKWARADIVARDRGYSI